MKGICFKAHFFLVNFVAINGAILAPPWADPAKNPCANLPGGWLLLYWPQDGQCYRIFQRGSPCPKTMELTPGLNGTMAECKCPPGEAQLKEENTCYPINSKGPCKRGEYFAPIPDSGRKRLALCKSVEVCNHTEAFWPATGKCYTQFTRGACPHGQLLSFNKETGLGECYCSAEGPMGKYFWSFTKTCHQFYTKGPCIEKGALFLPGPMCGCNPRLPHFYPPSSKCYEIGTVGPCKPGQIFTGHPNYCECKPEHKMWTDGNCYRLYTKGPCQSDQLLSADGKCVKIPCNRGKLYFPEENACYHIGDQGPCPKGQLVLFEQSVRPSIEGISYRGMCGCPGKEDCKIPKNATEERQILYYEAALVCNQAEDDQKMCYQLYSQGPCDEGAWLVPVRQRKSKEINRDEDEVILFRGNERKVRAQCECRPRYSKLQNGRGCRLPLFSLAAFLNGKDYFR